MIPAFRYHPDPVATGAAIPATAPCEVCRRDVALVYEGPFYAIEEPSSVCLSCIADGSAARAFDGEFTDLFDGDVPDDVRDEVLHRTPGFTAWQSELWLTHCGDAAAFLDRAGTAELAALPDARDDLVERGVRDGMTRDAMADVLESLHRDGDCTAYLFRCLHCGTHLAYWDCG